MTIEEEFRNLVNSTQHTIVCWDHRNHIVHNTDHPNSFIFSLSGDGICFEFRTIIEMMYDTSCQF